jgi:sortase A
MPHSPILRLVRLILLIVGIVCLGIFSYSYLYRSAYQIYEGWRFDHDVDESSPTAAPAPEVEPAPGRTPEKTTSLPAVLPDPDKPEPASESSVPSSVVGRISIPRLHISAMVEEGVDDTVLGRAVGHIPGTALPGHPGNIGVAGHRDTFFRKLKDLQPHDRIDFTTHSGRYHYTVESLRVVDPSDVSVLKAVGGQTLTLVTCFPFYYIGNAPRRFIVRAVSM